MSVRFVLDNVSEGAYLWGTNPRMENPMSGFGLYYRAYRGYVIREDLRGDFHVSKDGFHITTQSSLSLAWAAVDALCE